MDVLKKEIDLSNIRTYKSTVKFTLRAENVNKWYGTPSPISDIGNEADSARSFVTQNSSLKDNNSFLSWNIVVFQAAKDSRCLSGYACLNPYQFYRFIIALRVAIQTMEKLSGIGVSVDYEKKIDCSTHNPYLEVKSRQGQSELVINTKSDGKYMYLSRFDITEAKGLERVLTGVFKESEALMSQLTLLSDPDYVPTVKEVPSVLTPNPIKPDVISHPIPKVLTAYEAISSREFFYEKDLTDVWLTYLDEVKLKVSSTESERVREEVYQDYSRAEQMLMVIFNATHKDEFEHFKLDYVYILKYIKNIQNNQPSSSGIAESMEVFLTGCWQWLNNKHKPLEFEAACNQFPFRGRTISSILLGALHKIDPYDPVASDIAFYLRDKGILTFEFTKDSGEQEQTRRLTLPKESKLSKLLSRMF